MKALRVAFCLVLGFTAQHLLALDQYSLDLHLKVSLLKESSAPQLFGNDLIFTYKPAHLVRLVGIAFSDEDFAVVHPLYRNTFGVYFYVRPVPAHGAALLYRYVVDGLWTTDPSNPDEVVDSSGVALSQVIVPATELPIVASPVYRGQDEVQFFFRGPSDQSVSIAGDFNHWDPFVDRLHEIRRGVYSITLRIRPGTHAYYFVSDGTRISDPLNAMVEESPDGNTLSIFSVP